MTLIYKLIKWNFVSWSWSLMWKISSTKNFTPISLFMLKHCKLSSFHCMTDFRSDYAKANDPYNRLVSCWCQESTECVQLCLVLHTGYWQTLMSWSVNWWCIMNIMYLWYVKSDCALWVSDRCINESRHVYWVTSDGYEMICFNGVKWKVLMGWSEMVNGVR